ncbi:MAG TPA: flavodoxin domain-containing protein [Streptomyces sp.]|nr:flavodoxin domain-containing protein [Streptomyces sp.]
MPSSALVAYGSTNGSTAQVAEVIAETLRVEGITAEARPAKEVTDLTSYQTVVVGGGLYAGRWHKDARRFVRRHRCELPRRQVWLFSSGPLDASASERDIPPVPGVRRAMDRIGAREHITFGGCLKEGAKGFIAGKIVSSGKGGDFRDFAQIEAWARGIATELKKEQATN